LPTPQAVRPSGSSGPFRIQVGAVRSEDAVRTEWDRLRRAHPDLLGPLAVNSARADLGERGVFYRLQAGPVTDAGEAERLCAELKQRNVGCIVVRP
jgi:cell division septation protein DedD